MGRLDGAGEASSAKDKIEGRFQRPEEVGKLGPVHLLRAIVFPVARPPPVVMVKPHLDQDGIVRSSSVHHRLETVVVRRIERCQRDTVAETKPRCRRELECFDAGDGRDLPAANSFFVAREPPA